MKNAFALPFLLLALVDISVLAQDKTPQTPATLEAARAIFDKYVSLERAFDPAAADLYAPDAVIRNKRTYPTGEVRELTIPAAQYKELVRQAMPVAKLRGDTNRYSNCKYAPESGRVRITCERYSEVKKYSSPISLLVGAGPRGDWLIFEELSESQP